MDLDFDVQVTDDQVLGAVRAATDTFFDRPLDAKLACASPAPEINRGYAARGTESLTYSLGIDRPADLFEAFNIGPDEVDEDDPAIAVERHRLFAPNIWPDDQDLVTFPPSTSTSMRRCPSCCSACSPC